METFWKILSLWPFAIIVLMAVVFIRAGRRLDAHGDTHGSGPVDPS